MRTRNPPFVHSRITPPPTTATATAFAIANPQLQGVPKRYDSMSAFMSRTLREGGVRGLFRGVTPTLAMITPQMGVSFAAWEALKANPPAFVVAASAASATSAVSWQLSAGAIAGMAGKLVMFPLDTVKKRVQTAVRKNGRGDSAEGVELGRMGRGKRAGLGLQLRGIWGREKGRGRAGRSLSAQAVIESASLPYTGG